MTGRVYNGGNIISLSIGDFELQLLPAPILHSSATVIVLFF